MGPRHPYRSAWAGDSAVLIRCCERVVVATETPQFVVLEEIGHSLVHDDHSSYNTTPFIMLRSTDFVVDDKAQETAQLEFLKKYANRFVNAFRRRLPKTK